MPCSGSFSSPSTQAAIALAGFLHSTPGDTGLASAGEHHLADHQGKEPLRCKPKPRAVPAGLVPAALRSEARCRATKSCMGRGCAPAPAARSPREKCQALGAEAAGAARGQHGGTHLSLAPDGREFCRTDRGAVPSPAATRNGGDTASEKHRAEVDQNQVLFPFRFMQAGPFWLPSCALTLGTRSPGQTIAMVQFQTGFPIQVVLLFYLDMWIEEIFGDLEKANCLTLNS